MASVMVEINYISNFPNLNDSIWKTGRNNHHIVLTTATRSPQITGCGYTVWKAHDSSFPNCICMLYLEHGHGFCTYINFRPPGSQSESGSDFPSFYVVHLPPSPPSCTC